MTFKTIMKSGAAAIILAGMIGTPVAAQKRPTSTNAAKSVQRVITLEVGSGEQINLPVGISDVVTSNPGIADVDVRNPRQIYIFGKKAGQSTVYATDAAGRTVYAVEVQVAQNVNTVDKMLKLAMPESDIQTTFLNGLVLLTGTVAQPEDVTEAQTLVSAFMGEKEGSDSPVRVISRLKTAVPLQVNLQVKVAELSRSLSKDINSNFETRDNDGPSGNGFLFSPARGRDVATITDITDPTTGAVTGTSFRFNNPAGGNVLNMAKNLFGIDFALGLDFAERNGLAATLAQPNLTTVSGETAEFLAGGQFPIPIADADGAVTIEFRDYGVKLQYTPTVMADGRINLRVRPEVSEITSTGAIRLSGTEIPGINTRMAETTVVLGSGESFMIAGLMSNSSTTSIDKYPGLGDVPVLGALFKSNGWRRNETELVIVVTPYLVKPVSESQIKLPTDGYNAPNDLERLLLNKVSSDKGAGRPVPKVAPDASGGPEFGAMSEAPQPVSAKPAKQAKAATANSGPGFSF